MENFWLSIIGFLNRVLMLLALRGKPKFWGIVYDSRTKQPVDPAIVKLIEVQSGKVVGTCVTDLFGHYWFLIFPGKFKLFVQRTNYRFPSQLQLGNADGVYKNLYHGEFFEATGDTDVIALNIPLDPLRPDWNQKAKLSVAVTSPLFERLVVGVVASLFWAGLILSSALYYFRPQKFFEAILIAYAVVLLLAWWVPRIRLWGRVKGIKANQKLHIELAHMELPDIIIGKSQVSGDGKYYLRVPPGHYLLKLIIQAETGAKTLIEERVKVREDGIVNRIIKLPQTPNIAQKVL